MKLPMYQIDAFADRPFTGNPAAVCPLPAWLPDELLQAIAAENNLSETAYYTGSDGLYHLRWFTPTTEVNLCGHATLAAAHVVFATEMLAGNRIVFDSRSGPLPVTREGTMLTLDFPSEHAEPCAIPDILIQAIGRKPCACFCGDDYMAVFDEEEDIVALKPDFRLLNQLDLRGVIVTAPGRSADFVSRFFAPKFGIDEDPVTGSAHCMLAPYWIKQLGKSALHARQLSKRTGNLWCRMRDDRVLISGHTTQVLHGVIEC